MTLHCPSLAGYTAIGQCKVRNFLRDYEKIEKETAFNIKRSTITVLLFIGFQ